MYCIHDGPCVLKADAAAALLAIHSSGVPFVQVSLINIVARTCMVRNSA